MKSYLVSYYNKLKGACSLNMEKHDTFLGTYFSKDTVLKLASASKIFSWVIAGFYILQWFLLVTTFILQFMRGFWNGMGFTDIAQNVFWLFEQPLRGVVYFVVLQGVAQALLLFMDMEDNTRRAARDGEKK
jgi:hypothetical protein